MKNNNNNNNKNLLAEPKDFINTKGDKISAPDIKLTR